MMNNLKSKILILISSIMIITSICVVSILAFYRFFYQNNGSKLSLVEVVFTVNESNVKNTKDVVYFSTDEMSQGDGYEIVLNYSINGTFSSTNAVKYSTFFNDLEGGKDGNRDLTLGIEVYRFNLDRYEYLGTLYSLLYENSNESVLTDYLGSSGTNKEKFMFVYGEAAVVENRVPFALQISTTSEVVTTDSNDFPYYYLSNLGKNTAESILEQLPKNNSVYGRTIVLMRDIDYHGEDIVFDHVVGIDLNGHTLNLNGATITIKDTAETEESFISNLGIIDSKGTGSVENGIINLDLTKTVLDVELPLTNYVTTTSINYDVFNEIVQNNLNEIASQKRLMNTELNNTFSYHFDVLNNLKYYIKKGYVTLDASASDNYVSFDTTNYTFKAEGLDTSNIVYVSVATAYGSDMNIANANLSLYGKTLDDAVDYLKRYIPVTIDGSIYLPQYLPAFNTYVTWIPFDSSLIDENGTVLPNGYINLDSWVTKTAKLGFVLDQSGEIKSGVIDNITIEILSEEERAKLLHDFSITMFDYYNVTSYSFDTIDMIMYKRGIDISVDNQASFDAIKEVALNDFGINLDYTYPTTSISALKEEFKTRLFTKLGLDEITVSTINESNYVENVKDSSGNITLAHQLNLPKETLDLIYDVNYKFSSGNTITENKTIAVSNGENSTTATDITNTIRVPFDIYTRSMTTPISTSPYIYEKFVDTFELVSDFSGTPVNYTVDDEFKDYVEILNIDGKKYVHILTSKSPAETTKVKVYYDIAGTTNYVDFTLVGILHNGKEIVDANLYVELLAQYDVNKDNILTILEAEHAEGTDADWSSKGIVSLKGLRYFTNIKTLYLNNNKIIDISDLAYLYNLVEFKARNNYITDISALEYLDNLSKLNLRNNQITDISPLKGLTNLTELNLEFNKISDFRYIQDMTKLIKLRVFNNVSTTGISTVGTDSTDDGFLVTRRSNQYYFALLSALTNKCSIMINSISSDKATEETALPGATTFNNNTKQEALILKKIVTISEVDNVISLPTYININNNNYEITYFVDSINSPYVSITRNDDVHVTNVTINQIPVDNEVSIYANTVGLDVNAIYRKITFVILEGDNKGQIQLKDTNGTTFWTYASTLIPDVKLRAQIFKTFDGINGDDPDGFIEYAELTAAAELNLEFAGIKTLEGLQFFTGITSLNLRGNILNNNSDLWYVSHLQSLTTLMVDGQEFDFDYLVYFSRKDSTTYDKTSVDSFTVVDIIATNHIVDEVYGLTNLETLKVNGSYNLDDYSIKTELYHVYLNNNVSIYMQDETTVWDPIKDEVSKLLGSMTTSATFVNLYDTIEIAQKYSFYLYDDLLPTGFTLAYNKPTDAYYRNEYGSKDKDPVTTLYYIPENSSSTSNIGNGMGTVGNHGKIGTDRLFTSTTNTNTNIITIIYERLSAFDLTTYANMVLSSNRSLWNSKTIDVSTVNYALALNVQYNDNYKLYNDIDESDPINNNGGTSLNKVFGSVETMILVIDGLTSQMYGDYHGVFNTGKNGFNSDALRAFYYTKTAVDGTVSYYYKYGSNAAVLCNDRADAISRVENFVTSGTVEYDGTTQSNKTYSNGFIIYVSQLKKDFKYNNKEIKNYFIHSSIIIYLCMKTNYAELITDGLQYLPFIEVAQSSNGLKYGDGSTLVNLRAIVDIYGYANLSTISTPLPKLEGLYINKFFMTEFANENGASDADPSKLLSSYFVYMPNLRTFFCRICEETGAFGTAVSDWSAFLVYAYIPYGQTIDPSFYYLNDESGNILDMGNVTIGGMGLQDNQLYYYNPSLTIDSCFVPVYDLNGDLLDVTNYTSDTLTQKSQYNYYLYLYDENGNALSDSVSLFRKSQNNQFNYVYVGTKGLNSATVNQKITLTQTYLNAKPSITTWYYKLVGDYTNALPTVSGVGVNGDWDPNMVEVTFEPDSATEWSEFKDYYGHLDVKLTGQVYDGTSLNDTQFDSIDWNSVEYVDTFKKGLKVTFPIKTTEFITGDSELNEYREFPVTWRLLSLKNDGSIKSTDISESNATLSGNYYEYTFDTNGYYILVSKINNTDDKSLMYAFSITDKSEANFNAWYEKIKDRTLKYFVFQSGGEAATTINFNSISGISGKLNDNIAKKYFSAVYTLEGIDSLSNLASLTINNFFISFIPTLPSSIQTLDLQNNQIGDIGNILDGSSYPNLSTVDISNNLFSLKESNFKNDSYYSTNITSLKLYAPSNFECFINSTQIGYFNSITYVNPIDIHFKNELFYYYGDGAQNALPHESISAVKALLNKNNVSVYVCKSRWGNEANEAKLDVSNITNLEKAYNAIGNPTSRVTSASNAYSLDTTYGVTPTVSFVWSRLDLYEKMVKAYYQVAITVDGYTIVKELFGTFAADASSYSVANINGITIGTLQNTLDHRVLEGIYSGAQFGSDANAYTGTFNSNQISLSSGSLTLDLKGLNQFSMIQAIGLYYGAYFDTIINDGNNSISSISISSAFAMVKTINDTTGKVAYSFTTPISRSFVNIDANGDLIINGFTPSSVTVDNIYNYCLTDTFTISNFKTRVYNEITGNKTNEYYNKFSTTEGYVANLTSLHIYKGIRYYGASLYSNSVFKKGDKDILVNLIKYSINVDTNGKRVLTNGANMSSDEYSSGKRYVLLKTDTETSEIHFPLTTNIGGKTVTLTYSSTNSPLGLDDSNGSYLKMTPGTIGETTNDIVVRVDYSSSLGSGYFTFYVDVKTGSNASNDNYNEAITNWFVEMQDGSLVHAGDVFSSAVLTANIFNGIPKITFSTDLTTEISDAVSNSKTLINGNLLMDEVIIDGALSKVLRQSVISQIKSINILDRVVMYFDGLEIFYNCKSLQLCYHKKIKDGTNGGGAGYDFTFASNMQLETFIFYHKRNSIFAQDFSFLNNSRETLKCFKYGQTEHASELIPFQDMSWLLAFDNLETVELSGPSGIQNNPTFQYFLTAMYLKHHKDIVTYRIKDSNNEYYNYSNLNISDDIKSAATIMNNLSSFDTSTDSSFIYQNGFELFSKNGKIVEGVDYYLPSYLYSAGDYYKVEWNSLSTFVDINIVNNNNNVITVNNYEKLYRVWKEANPNSSDYDFCKDYQIKLRFKNLSSTTSYKAFISMKIEYESKFNDVYAPVTTTITDMSTNYAKYYTASYNALSEPVEFVKNKYYMNDSGNYKLLLVEPDDWASGTYYDMVYTQCTSSTAYDSGTKYYTRYIYEPHMFERILTINLAKNNLYKQYLIDEDAYSHADYVITNANVYDGTALSGTYYSSVTSSNLDVVEVVEHNVVVTESHYFVKDGNNLIRITADNINNYSSSEAVYYYFVGRVCAGVSYKQNAYYSYDESSQTFVLLTAKNAPTNWANTSSNYYSFTTNLDNNTSTIGAISLTSTTKVYGIYLKNPDYTGLVTLTCTLADGSGTETRYVYWER